MKDIEWITIDGIVARDKEIEQLREIVGIVENLHLGTDLFERYDGHDIGISKLITLLEKLGEKR